MVYFLTLLNNFKNNNVSVHTKSASDPQTEFQDFCFLNEKNISSRQRRKRFLIGTAVLTALLTVVGCLVINRAQGASTTGYLAISEVVSSNRTSLSDKSYGSPDWIELHNSSDSDINLSGYRITNNPADTDASSFGDITISAKGYLIVYAAELVSGSDIPCTDFPLSRDGESLYLIDPYDTVVQHISIPRLGPDISYALSSKSDIYGYCLTPTPGTENDTAIEAMEYYEGLAESANLEITEALPESSSGAAWVELFNAGSTNINLNLFYLSDNKKDSSPCHLPDTQLAAGEYALIHTSGTGSGLVVPFTFGSSDHGVYLTDISGMLRSSLTWSTYPGADVSVVGADTCTWTPTPGAANSAEVFHLDKLSAMDKTDAVHISEVLTSNKYSLADSDGDHCPWAEVCNTSNAPVSLAGYYLSDDMNDPLKWAFPNTTLESGGYIAVLLSGKTSRSSELNASFTLSADESTLYLTNISTMRTDTFTLPVTCDSDISVGRTETADLVYYSYPTPGAPNSNGFTSSSAALQSRADGVFISEVCAVGSDGDWIELYNGADKAVDLTGWYLSDDPDDPMQWQIPAMQIEAGGYTVIQAGGVTKTAAPFSIATSGEAITLTRSDGALIDAMETGTLRTGVTSGRIAGDTSMDRVFFSEPTPGDTNPSKTCTGYADVPVFSQSSLYCTNPFSLTITASDKDAAIYYTLDGSAPDDKAALYTEPISIDGSSVVRAVAYAPGLAASEVATETYLFETPHTAPVVCLAGDPAQMNTVLRKSTRNYKPEYAANVEYYETDGTLGINFPAGLKAKGRGSLQYAQKSMTIRLRGKYGRSNITYPFFDSGTVTTFSEITLRSGSQDIFGANIRDTFFQTLAQGMNVDSMRTKFVAVYINGAYWGLYSLDEEQAKGYFGAYYGVDNSDIDLVDRNETTVEGSNDDFLQIRRDARAWNLSDDEKFAEFSKLVDVDACMDYLILNTYFANGDVINQRFWHTKDGSVRWRPLLFDLDWCLRTYTADRNSFGRYFTHSALAGNGSVTYMDIFYGLKKNKAWCNAFIDRFIEMAYTNFDTDRILKLYDKMVSQMEPEMERQIERWHTHRSVASWRAKTDLLRRALEKRRDIVLKQMARTFGLSNNELEARIEAYTSTH